MSLDTDSPNLQFDKAEFNGPRGSSMSCEACGNSIVEFYFEINGKTFCADCKRKVEAQFTSGSKVKRFLKASIAGLLAALLGAGIYYGISKATGYEFGLVAILVGFMVGIAVRWGSNGRGGWPYQFLAMFLTYNAIVLTYIPMALSQFGDDLKAKQGNTPAISKSQATPNPGDSSASITPVATPMATDTTLASSVSATPGNQAIPAEAAATTQLDPTPEKNDVGIGTFVLGFGALLILAYSLPFLMGFQNILGLVIIAIGLYEAWKINKGHRVEINGPYRAGPPKAPPPAAP